MKKIFITIAILLAGTACVELDLASEGALSSGNMWTSEELADNGMNGLYRAFYRSLGNTQYSKQTSGLNRSGMEAMGFATAYYSSGYPIKLLTKATKPVSDWNIGYEWKFCYTIIHACNTALANLHKAGLGEEKLARYQCEARFLRAWAYNRLNMLYQGVPIYLQPITNEECTRTQSTADEVWQVVLDDLNYCIDNPHLPDNTLTGDHYGRPSKGAAYALRGMVYMWKRQYAEAAQDFEAVGKCGYGLWQGEYIDFFKPENEKDKEMIFAIQFDKTNGYADDIQQIVGPRDAYDGWDEIKPSVDFVNSYKNADGSDFAWSQVEGLEAWETLTDAQREVFFLRDGLTSNADYAKIKQGVIERIGQEIYDRYYLDIGNEARIRQAYENRDPRLKQTVVTPYEPVDTWQSRLMKGKELRWPLYDRKTNGDGGDLWLDKRSSAYYCFRKYVEFGEGRLNTRNHCHADWPLIRYTDVLLQWAEALTHQNDIAGAVVLVNRVRDRAHMPVLTLGGSGPCAVNGKEEMLERIRYEHRVEFCVEGVDFFQEVRWGTYKESKFQGQETNGGKNWWGQIAEQTWYYTDYMWPWTAPYGEIQKNPNLKRRDGWTY